MAIPTKIYSSFPFRLILLSCLRWTTDWEESCLCRDAAKFRTPLFRLLIWRVGQQQRSRMEARCNANQHGSVASSSEKLRQSLCNQAIISLLLRRLVGNKAEGWRRNSSALDWPALPSAHFRPVVYLRRLATQDSTSHLTVWGFVIHDRTMRNCVHPVALAHKLM